MIAQPPLQSTQSRTYDLIHGVPLFAELHSSRLDAHHVEEVLEETIQTISLTINGLRELAPRSGVEFPPILHQATGGTGDGGQGGPQVVGHRTENGVPHTLRFHTNMSLLCLF